MGCLARSGRCDVTTMLPPPAALLGPAAVVVAVES